MRFSRRKFLATMATTVPLANLARSAQRRQPKIAALTTVYHKYRIRFDPKVLGLSMPAVEFRDKLLDAVRAEGVSANLWHYNPLPSNPIFQKLDVGLGDGYPWRSPYYGRETSYNPEDYPKASEVLDTSICVNEERHPIFGQDMELMEHYVAAFRKVFDNLDELLA